MSETNYLPTPIPVGAPHMARPPMFDRWGMGPGVHNRLDRRDYLRRNVECQLWLMDLSGQSVLRCKTTDVSDAGLRATAPVGYGLAVGQRYELRFAHATSGAQRSTDGMLGTPMGYATVIRTEVRLTGGPSDCVAFALRFDVPQLLPA